MGLSRGGWIVLILAAVAACLAVWRLEGARAGLERQALDVGGTPATVWRMPDAGPAPVVVIAHGFAGSRQIMEDFAIALARAGHVAVTYDLKGHGRNPRRCRAMSR
jgi:alpha-beta hydrolase superfamily lysophospholipase